MSAFLSRAALAALLMSTTIAATPAFAEDVRIGLITTLSTPAGYIGEDIRDAFKLAMTSDGKLGKTSVKLEVEDDALKPANGKQSVDRQLESGIKLYTGVNFSNVSGGCAPKRARSQ